MISSVISNDWIVDCRIEGGVVAITSEWVYITAKVIEIINKSMPNLREEATLYTLAELYFRTKEKEIEDECK